MPYPRPSNQITTGNLFTGGAFKILNAQRSQKIIMDMQASEHALLRDIAEEFDVPVDMLVAEVYGNEGRWKYTNAQHTPTARDALRLSAAFLRKQLDVQTTDKLDANRCVYVAVITLDLAGKPTTRDAGIAFPHGPEDKEVMRALVNTLMACNKQQYQLEFVVDPNTDYGAALVEIVRGLYRAALHPRIPTIRFNNFMLADIVYVYIVGESADNAIAALGHDIRRAGMTLDDLNAILDGASWLRTRRVVVTLSCNNKRYTWRKGWWIL